MVSEAWTGAPAAVATQADRFPGGGAMAEAICRRDWSGSSLGPIESWPRSLLAITQMMLSSRQAMCLFWGPDLLMLYNDAYRPMLGRREATALGQPFEIAWADVWEDVLPITRSALSGVSQRLEGLPLLMTRNGFAEETYWTFTYSPLRDDEGRVAGLINVTTEVTEQVRDRQALVEAAAETARMLDEQRENNRQRMILQRELSHRMKNTLSIVQAIVSQSMRHSPDMATANDRISGRLLALSAAQDILTESSWVAADVSHVIARGLAPYRDAPQRILTDGPPARISADQALGLSLAIHELATNALKYGALAAAEGSVTIRWRVEPDQRFSFEWREADGPLVVATARRGFGSRLIERIVPSYFKGRAGTDFAPGGICYRLDGILEVDEGED
ncbi:PAS domain-containing sensor histidine kinase [Bosea sp. Leaf344]|uniref:PAS domain-containing sensor histidine kinase n=1 Tax=Bosea sp. Leaf344 TaxID=1736346 RepID=UPI000A96D31E|nr:PAS domain-containing sensor histidine kinase [Bosea sp. Leaf344]